MIRDHAVPRPVRSALALFGVAGAVSLAGCATADAGGAGAASDTSAGYADGTYSASGAYQTPESVESVEVTVTLEDDVITAVEVVGDPQARESQRYQSQFIGGIADEVVGKRIDEISVSRVAGSSLTSGGFNKAIEQIKGEAAA
ncbi:hypothetical protein F6J84_05015 [Microbacterium caowuchunii]|uniref:FMN-binding protein n=1 Tax=Microbacterium caowuchunii TaxID=2614638 RepID=UPI0012477D64|nr:FMN-binding protein [Microbacterium caowuchunii]QEW01432.1 hypothetical protein F6J84_05015 [Microbacterium caowuchunii]